MAAKRHFEKAGSKQIDKGDRMFGHLKVLIALLGAAAVLALAGCGGNVGGGGVTSVTGTAGSGAPAIGATVTMVCAGGTAGTPVTVSTTGTFTVTATGAAPCVIKMTGGNISATLYPTGMFSIVAAGAQTRANINQLTHYIASKLAKGDPDALLFKIPAGLAASVTSTNYGQAKKEIIDNVIANLGGAVTISLSFDPVEGSYSADGTGFDKLLDNVAIAGTTTLTITFKPTGAVLLTVVLSTGVVTGSTTVIGSGSFADLGGLQLFEDSLRTVVFATTATFADLNTAMNALSGVVASTSALFVTAPNGLFEVVSSAIGSVKVKSAFAAFASRTSQAPTLVSIVGTLSNGLGLHNVGLNFTDTAGTATSISAQVNRQASGSTASAWRLNNITAP
jgi:hypothetical protein